MPGGFGGYLDSLGMILEIAGRDGVTTTRLHAMVKARFDRNDRWLRNIVSFLVNVGLLRQEGDRTSAPHTSPSSDRVIRALHGSIRFVGEMLAEIGRNPLTHDEVADVARSRYGLVLGDSRVNDRRGWLESAGMIAAAGSPRTLALTRRGRELLAKLEQSGLLVPPADRATAPGRKRNAQQSTGKARSVLPPNDENLESERATAPLTAWLIHAAKLRGTMTYGKAKHRLESDCGFGDIFTVRIGRVAGVAMNRILEHAPRAPMLNVLLVQAATRLPGSGAAGYLAIRNPGKRWLRGKDAHRHAGWRSVVEDEARRVYGYSRWDEVYQQIYGHPLPGAAAEPPGREKDGKRGTGGEGPNHCALRLKVWKDPGLVQKGLPAKGAETELELLSGDRVDVVAFAPARTVAIEVKSRDSDWSDLRRGVYQCVKYRAVMEAQDIRQKPVVESWLVTEKPLPHDLTALARLLGVRTKVLT